MIKKLTILDEISAFGHENILCTHNTTIELTKDEFVSKKGNCILGIKASKSCNNLNSELKNHLFNGKTRIKVSISAGSLTDCFYGVGNKDLTLLNKKDMVFRKSEFVCDRTVLIKCTKSSSDLNRKLINKLKSPNIKFYITFENINDN
jgi:hypothetical protein